MLLASSRQGRDAAKHPVIQPKDPHTLTPGLTWPRCQCCSETHSEVFRREASGSHMTLCWEEVSTLN